MKWIDHQVDIDADLKRKVDEYLKEMMLEQKLATLRTKLGCPRSNLPSDSA